MFEFKSTLISAEEFAASLGLTVAALAVWRRNGYGPKYLKIGQSVYYRQLDIEEFVLKNIRAPGPKGESGCGEQEESTNAA